MTPPRVGWGTGLPGGLPALLLPLVLAGCDGGGAPGPSAWGASAPGAAAHGEPLADSVFAGLVSRISEPGGYFDTDNLISNETGYLKVMGALDRLGIRGGAYVGVAPDQNFSYIARIRPEVAFVIDIRRDNLLHHLLLKALMEISPTRVEYLAALLGRAPPGDPGAWEERPLAEVLAWVAGAPRSREVEEALHARVAEEVSALGIPLDTSDMATIRRFHRSFMEAGLELRFTSFGRIPRPYYPTFRQLLAETDLEGEAASYLATADGYAFVRGLQLANRIVPVVGDLAGGHAVRELGQILGEIETPLTAFYVSNVEFYLWRDGSFPAWLENLATLPAAPGAVVIRSYFPNFGTPHPSAVPGYFATQTLQPVSTLTAGGFGSYWEVVTRDAVPLR